MIVPSRRRMTRRAALLIGATLAGAGGLGRSLAAPRAGPRIVAVDWAAAETLLTAGIRPVGIADLAAFRAIFPDFGPLEATAELGSAYEPNLELVDWLRPERIYVSSWSGLSRPLLAAIAPVETCAIYGSGDPLANAAAFAEGLLQDFPHAPSGGDLGALHRALGASRDSLAGAGRRVLLIGLHGSGRFANVFGAGSLPGSVLAHLGGENAWQGSSNGFGFANIGIETLIDQGDSDLVIIDQGAQTARALRVLGDSALWRAVPAVREARTAVSVPLSIFGGLASAARFAGWLAAPPRRGA